MSLETLETAFWHSTQVQKTWGGGGKGISQIFFMYQFKWIVCWKEKYNPCVGKANHYSKEGTFLTEFILVTRVLLKNNQVPTVLFI